MKNSERNIIVFVVTCSFFLVFLTPSISGNEILINVNDDESQTLPLIQGNIITVDDDLQQCPYADFKNLNLAMDYANSVSNDVTGVDVYPGEYLVGHGAYGGISIDKPNMHLLGVDGALKTVIDGEGFTTILIENDDIEVSGFTIKSTSSLGPSGIKVGDGLTIDAVNIVIHDCIFDLPYSPWEDSTVYGLELTEYCSNVEVYNNDFICNEENALDEQEIGYWHDNFWEDWDGMWDYAVQGEPYEKNGVYDSSPRWDPYVCSRPSTPSISGKKVFLRIYKYTIVSTDEDGDGLHYSIRWGGEYDYTTDSHPKDGYISQGESFVIKHRWKLGEERMVRVYVSDEHDLVPRESATLTVDYGLNNRFIDFLENHPLLYRIFYMLT